jgi:hypothetical protein
MRGTMPRSLVDTESSSEALRFLFFTKTLLDGGVLRIAFSEVRVNNFYVSVCGICEQLGQIRCAIMNRAHHANSFQAEQIAIRSAGP